MVALVEKLEGEGAEALLELAKQVEHSVAEARGILGNELRK